jgi:hypothetical protein
MTNGTAKVLSIGETAMLNTMVHGKEEFGMGWGNGVDQTEYWPTVDIFKMGNIMVEVNFSIQENERLRVGPVGNGCVVN